MKLYRLTVILIFLLLSNFDRAQSNFHRTYVQNTQGVAFYTECNMPPPVRTADKGFIFSFNPYSPGLHNYNAFDYYLFKTDSNFLPQWKKNYSTKAIPLPTGGIILYWSVNFIGMNGPQYSIIEKVTASGQQVWCKIINSDTRINEGVQYDDKIRFVGGIIAIMSQIPYTQYSNYPYTIEFDTLGNLLSQRVFTHPLGQQTEFKGIKRDANGNFYVLGGWYYMVLAKFSPSFNPIWAKYHFQNNQQLYFIDSDVLSNGQIVCTGEQQSQGTVLMRLDSSGNTLDQKLFPATRRITGLCKLPSGNYAIGLQKSHDSLCLFEINTNFSVSNFRYAGKGLRLGTPVLNQGELYFMRFVKNPVLFKNNNNLTNCLPPAPYTMLTSTLQLSSFHLSPSNYTATISNYTSSPVLPQFYVDSCKCAAGVTGNTSFCSQSQSSLSLYSYGPVNWYNVPSGGVPIWSGFNFLLTGINPGTYTLYVEDSSCISMGRLPLTVNVKSQPTISLVSSTVGACEGSIITYTAQGANSYTWNNGQTSPVMSDTLLHGSNSYTAIGSGTNGCIASNTISTIIYPTPSLVISTNTPSICVSQTAVISVSGASTYIWNNGNTNSTISVSPSSNQQYTVTGISSLGCVSGHTIAIAVYPNPTINISGSPTLICTGETTSLLATGAQSYSWNTGQSTNSFTASPTQSYLYIVTGTNHLGCYAQASAWIYVDICTNMTTEDKWSPIILYPNPTKNVVYFKSSKNAEFEFTLYNYQGILLRGSNNRSCEFLDFTDYPIGIYFVQIKEQKKLTTVKVIKQ